jgi:hypothetical protein
VFRFAEVFEVTNQGANTVRIGADKSGLSHPDRITVFTSNGYQLSGADEEELTISGGPALTPGSTAEIGIKIDTTGEVDDITGGTLSIVADISAIRNPDPNNENDDA